ncbi:hypothetical protein [Streptomyces sp. NPDC086023]|uniref:hypothetical protein n=1 Tax=Streptomyces sp. NPDC086023 TaxID=3365746 RepID=UPI0037D72EA1
MEQTRRAWLLDRIEHSDGPYTTHWAETELSASPFSCHRNSARKTLRSLVADGALVPIETGGRRAYLPTTNSERSAA